MRIKYIIAFMLIVALLFGTTSSKAQGFIVHKKDGSSIKVPYNELLIISTYNYNEPPAAGEVDGMKTFDVNGVTFNMIFVEGANFEMGATPEQSNGYTPSDNEYPVHTVTLSDYYIGQTEVTQELWLAVMNAEPSSDPSWNVYVGLGDKYPAYCISYIEGQEFINKLNNITGVNFRMPTEAEWEFAARGGKYSCSYIFSGSNNVDDVAWCSENTPLFYYGRRTQKVGTKEPNELGIYDMSGNVDEWCSDWYGSYSSATQTNPTGPSTGTSRVYRGGHCDNSASSCRVARRSGSSPDRQYSNYGFRLAL